MGLSSSSSFVALPPTISAKEKPWIGFYPRLLPLLSKLIWKLPLLFSFGRAGSTLRDSFFPRQRVPTLDGLSKFLPNMKIKIHLHYRLLLPLLPHRYRRTICRPLPRLRIGRSPNFRLSIRSRMRISKNERLDQILLGVCVMDAEILCAFAGSRTRILACFNSVRLAILLFCCSVLVAFSLRDDI